MRIRKPALSVCILLLGVFLIVAVASTTALAQQQGRQGRGRGGPGGFGGRGGGFGFGGGGLMGLLRMEEVRKEVEMIGDQEADVEKLQEELSNARRQGGGERPDFRNMSEAEREKFFADMRRRAEEQAKVAKQKLAEILLPHQMERLEEINLQVLGVRALQDQEVAVKLGISAAQKQKIDATIEENTNAQRELMSGMFQGGRGGRGGEGVDREQMRAQFEQMRERMEQMRERQEKLRKEGDAKVLAVLTPDQKTEFAAMKGEPFEMPQRGFMGGRGRGQRGGGEGGEAQRRQGRPRPDV
jgi:Spy/CpxP family protein refolding chaperone